MTVTVKEGTMHNTQFPQNCQNFISIVSNVFVKIQWNLLSLHMPRQGGASFTTFYYNPVKMKVVLLFIMTRFIERKSEVFKLN